MEGVHNLTGYALAVIGDDELCGAALTAMQ
jgi:hypothetical protein